MTNKKKSDDKISIEQKIINSLEKVRPQLQMDGGDVSFVEFDEKTGIVKVRLMGMCSHCPMSQMTLKQGIAEEIIKDVPEVKDVVSV
jgi:Fe-S cluster biogenesis protein NfuA